jgi:four helix bundle protein
MKLTSYKDLLVWQKAMELTSAVYFVSIHFPQSESFGLTSQIRRSAISIPSNIAEGSNRGSTREYLQFLNIAMGSAAELETQLLLAKSIGYLDEPQSALADLDEVRRMLSGLIKSLRNK